MTLIKSSIPLTVYRAESSILAILPLKNSSNSPSAPSTTCRKKRHADSSIVMTCSIRNGSIPYRKKGIIWLLASGWT